MHATRPHTRLTKKFTSTFGFILNPMVMLVFFSFLFQSFYPANGSTIDAGLPPVQSAIKGEKAGAFLPTLVQAPIPQKVSLEFLEVCLSTEDDENRRNQVSDLSNPFSGFLLNNEGGYNSRLNQRFLHLNSQVNQRPAISFFILYHSWKSDLG